MYLSPRTSVNQPAPGLGDNGMARGYQPLYHLDIVNRCPGCGKSHWHVGRFSAECAHCETTLPLAMVDYSRTIARTNWYDLIGRRLNNLLDKINEVENKLS